MDLITYIKSRNAEILAWINEDPSNRGACIIIEDVSFWNNQGIFTVEDFERDSLISQYCDVYEDAHNGFSPTGFQVDALKKMSIADLKKELDWMCEYAKASIEAEAQSLKEWEAEQNKAEAYKEAEKEWSKWQHYYDQLVGS